MLSNDKWHNFCFLLNISILTKIKSFDIDDLSVTYNNY